MEKLDCAVAVVYQGKRLPIDLPEPGPLDLRKVYQFAGLLFAGFPSEDGGFQGLKDASGERMVVPFSEVPKDLFAVDTPQGGGRWDGKVRHEVRLVSIRDSAEGIVRADPPVDDQGLISRWLSRLDIAMRELETEQPKARWRIAGALVRTVATGKVRIAFIETAGATSVLTRLGEWPKTAPIPKGGTDREGQGTVVEDRAIELALVVYDTKKDAQEDPMRKHGHDSPGGKYFETRALRDMPPMLFRSRDEAQKVWTELTAAFAEASRSAIERAGLSNEEIVELSKTMPAERIATLFDVPLREVQAVVKRAEAAAAKAAKA